MLWGMGIGGGEGAGDPRQIDIGNFSRGQIAGNDLAPDMVGLPLGREVVAEFARNGMLAPWADIDLQ